MSTLGRVMTSDADLIRRSLDRDIEAFVEVVWRHESALGAYLARRVGHAAAEDLLGDVWVAAFESRGHTTSRSPMRGRGCTGWR